MNCNANANFSVPNKPSSCESSMKLCHFQDKIKLTIKLSRFFFREKKITYWLKSHHHNDTQKNHFGFPIKIINHKNQKYVEKGKGQFETENWVQMMMEGIGHLLFEK